MNTVVYSAVCDWSNAEVAVERLPAPLRAEVLGKPEWARRQSGAARLTARALLAGSGVTQPPGSGRVGRDWQISLSHCAEVSGVAIAPPGVAIGVDVERCDERNAELLPRLLSAGELVPAVAGDRARYASLLFSLKEAAFKASGQRYCRHRLFRTVLDPATRGIATVACLDAGGRVGVTFNAGYWFDEGLVITVVCSSGRPVAPLRLAPAAVLELQPS